MYRILQLTRILPTSIIVRLNSAAKIPIHNLPTIDDDDEDDDVNRAKTHSLKDDIFADSKSARFKEKNIRKQKRWQKELEHHKVDAKTPLSSFIKEKPKNKEHTKVKNSESEIVRDTYVTSDGIIRQDNFQINFDADIDQDEQEKESEEPIPLAVGGRRYPVWYYAGKLKQLASQNKVQETLDYFYNEMMDKERVAPNLFCYQVVIGICARNGYLTQAFELYREMKDRGYTTVDSRKMTKIFTLLATACYRVSDSTMAVERATYFLDEMKTKGFRIEYQTFNALIAAFGKHGQIKMAFQLADEMAEVGFVPNEDTYASLLIACNSEKNVGFKYAIEIWRRMLAFDIKPTEFHFGLLLDIAHNCGLGSLKSLHALLSPPQTQQFLLDDDANTNSEVKVRRGPSFLSSIDVYDIETINITSESTHSTIDNNDTQQLVSSSSSNELMSQANDTKSEIASEWWQDPDDIRKGHVLRNHLLPFSNASILKPGMSYEKSNLVALRVPCSPSERLMLLGGIPGVLKHMQECSIIPNNIIFNSFLNLIPSLVEHEEALVQVSNTCHVKPDIRFYNSLILRRQKRGAKDEALKVLDYMREQCLSPDEYTFSALAKGCWDRFEAEQLMNDMTELNIKPNQKVLEAMLKNAFHRINFPLLSLICESHGKYGLAVNKTFLERVEKFLMEIHSKILAMERANVDTDEYRRLSSSYDRFQKFYKRWLNQVPYAKRFDQKISFRFDKPDLKK